MRNRSKEGSQNHRLRKDRRVKGVNISMQELDISFGKHCADTNWKPEYLTWEEFVDRLRQVRRTGETMEQYDKMRGNCRSKVKDGPAFIGGLVRGGRRKKENVDSRSLITLDADYADEGFRFAVELVLGGAAYVISTHSHRQTKPKYRLIAPADRPMSPDEYAAVSRKLAENIGMGYFDKTTFDVHRLMYLPSCSQDADPLLEVYEGGPLKVDNILTQYEDWQDVMRWPRHKADKAVTGKKAQDPREKQSLIGLFCRAYTMEEGIDTFLSDVYVSGSIPNRYTYVQGTSANGLEVYPEQDLAYSHQDSDLVADGRTYNLFDLVRVHKFGHLDDKVSITEDRTKLPSYAAMKHYVETLNKVKEVRQEEASAQFQEGFDKGEIDFSTIQIPTGYKIMGGKIFEVKELKNDIKYVPVCDCMVAVIGRHLNLTDGTHGLEVIWKIQEVSRTISDARSTFMDSKKIINLSDYGLPVHSSNARALACYLSRFESENEQHLTKQTISNQMGWVKDGFLLGETFIGEGDIQFRSKDTGDSQIAKGFHSKGSKENMLEVLQKLQKFTAVKMTIYAALSAPLLQLWDENSYIFELAGGTSRGKTTALRIAASLFGCPDEQKPGFFKQWNMTKVFVERYAGTMNHLPLFIDDTKKADPRMIPPTVYQFCSGQGRGRGSLKSTQAGATWCTVLLSSGEQKLTSFSKDGGAVGRVLSLHGSPFESTDIETSKLVDEINKEISKNYGHLAELWIRYIRDKKVWKKKLDLVTDAYRKQAAGYGEVAMRLSRIMAILDVTGQMFDDCFNLKLHNRDELKREWIKLLTGATEIDRPLEALEDVMGWVSAHHRQFIKDEDGSHYGHVLSGRIKRDEIMVIGEQLDSYLQSKEYEPTSIARAWKDKGWLNTEEDRVKKRIRIAGGRTYAYCFNLDKIGWTYEIEKDYSEFREDCP